MRPAAPLLFALGACGGTVILGGTPAHDGGGEPDATRADATPDEAAADAASDADAFACAAFDAGDFRLDGGDAGVMGPPPTVLASGQAAPTGLLLHAGTLYWPSSAQDAIDAGAIMSLPLAACPNDVRPIATGLTAPTAITISGSDVYWLTDGTNEQSHADGMLARVRLDGGAAPTALTGRDRLRPTGLTVGAGRLFWTEQGIPPYTVDSGGVFDCPMGGCIGSPEVIASGTAASPLYRAYGIATDGTTLYFSVLGSFGAGYTDGAIYSCPVATCPGNVATVIGGQRVTDAIVLQGTTLYWTTEGWPPDASDGTVMKCSLPSCAATAAALATGRNQTHALAVDTSNVYFSELGASTVSRVPVDGGAVTTLFQGTSAAYGVALDDASVYFAIYGKGAADGAVLRLPK